MRCRYAWTILLVTVACDARREYARTICEGIAACAHDGAVPDHEDCADLLVRRLRGHTLTPRRLVNCAKCIEVHGKSTTPDAGDASTRGDSEAVGDASDAGLRTMANVVQCPSERCSEVLIDRLCDEPCRGIAVVENTYLEKGEPGALCSALAASCSSSEVAESTLRRACEDLLEEELGRPGSEQRADECSDCVRVASTSTGVDTCDLIAETCAEPCSGLSSIEDVLREAQLARGFCRTYALRCQAFTKYDCGFETCLGEFERLRWEMNATVEEVAACVGCLSANECSANYFCTLRGTSTPVECPPPRPGPREPDADAGPISLANSCRGGDAAVGPSCAVSVFQPRPISFRDSACFRSCLAFFITVLEGYGFTADCPSAHSTAPSCTPADVDTVDSNSTP